MDTKIQIELSKNHARNALYAAAQALEVTYPLIKEPKILVLAVLSLERCNIHLMNTFKLWNESRQNPPSQIELSYEFDSVFNTYHSCIEMINSQNLSTEDTLIISKATQFTPTIHKIHEYAQTHLEAPIEFTRKNAYVMCDKTYHLTLLQLEELEKEYIKTKIFINEVIIPLL